MRRRDFIGGVASLALLPVARAQPRKARLGLLVVSSPQPMLGLLRDGLRSRGYAEGQNLEIDVRSAQGKLDRLPALAAELVRLKVDVLIGWQTPPVHALKQATREIPIVMMAGDPVATGVVANLARPEGNITGVSSTTAALGGKTLELIRELVPAARRVAVLANASDPFTKPFLAYIRDAAGAAAMEIRAVVLRGPDEYAAAFAEFVKWRADAVIVQPSLPRDAAIDLAMKHRLPSLSPTGLFPQAGGLASYAASTVPLYSMVAIYVDKVLKGAKPAELPIEQPSTFELVINLKAAKALGVKVSRSLLARADKLIE